MKDEADVIIVGAGLAGLVAAAELIDAGRRVIILEQEPEASVGGQAFWSFGGLFFVNSPDQRRLGIAIPMSWPGRTGLAARGLIGKKTIGLVNGHKPTSPLRQARNTPGYMSRVCALFRLCNGRSAEGILRRGMAIRCHAFTLRGERVRGSWSHLSGACAKGCSEVR